MSDRGPSPAALEPVLVHAMRYFRLDTRRGIHGNWKLDDLVDARGQSLSHPFMFTEGRPVSVEGPLKVPLASPGRSTDYSVAGIGDTPIVHDRLASVLKRLAPDDVQILPAQVEGQAEPHGVLVATRTVPCIDDAQCAEVQYREAKAGSPEKDRQYKRIRGLRIDPAKVGRAQIFRPQGWTVVLLVSDDIRQALMLSGLSGLDFDEVTGPKEDDLSADNS